jgi:hypothetical protein
MRIQRSVSRVLGFGWGGAVTLGLALTLSAGEARADGAAAPTVGASGLPLVQAPADPAPLGGGLLPPPPPDSPEATQTVQTLERAERLDSRRGLSFVWLSVDPAFAYSTLSFPGNSKLLDDALVKPAAVGFGVGGTVGVRFLSLSLAARFRYVAAKAYDDWGVSLLASWRVPIGRIEPYVSVGGGYVRAFGFDGDAQVYALGNRVNELVVDGGKAFVEGGLDYYVTPVFSVGLGAEAGVLFLGRKRTVEAADSVFGSAATAVGFGATASLVLGLHL